MIKKKIEKKSLFKINESYEADPIEIYISKIIEQNSPVEATSPIIYTERKDGVLPEYDIRTDRFEIAQEAMNKISKTYIERRNQNDDGGNDGGNNGENE